MSEYQKLKERLSHSCLSDVKQMELLRYFEPIYYVYFATGDLFHSEFKVAFYHETRNAVLEYARETNAIKVIEKSMYSGREKIIEEWQK